MRTKRKYQVTDKNGKVHKRTTTSREYQFAVVHHCGEHKWGDHTFPAYSQAEWAGRRDLAEAVARRWRTQAHCIDVEIIAAVEV